MDYLEKIIGEIEMHSVEGIRECFENGVDPNQHYKNEPLIFELTSEYARTPRFKECVKVFVLNGLSFSDQPLLSVLLDDAQGLDAYVQDERKLIEKKYSLRCAFTPLVEVTLLHICAEFNHVACAEVLLKHGADVNARAGIDEDGFGGQSPVFHTVNQFSNNSIETLNLLLAQNIDLELTVKGLVWGKGYEWETLIPSVNPINYAMMGLLPQMHRSETVISGMVSRLLKGAYGIDYTPKNVPNKYLRH